MATFSNPGNKQHSISGMAAGELVWDRFTFDLSASYASGVASAASIIEIGYVPAGFRLVENLSRLYLPVFDSNVSPTGDIEVGVAGTVNALVASQAAETAAAVTALLRQTTSIGSDSADTPIILTVINALATAGTGVIVFEPVYRASSNFLGE
jgi:hypothetical protein